MSTSAASTARENGQPLRLKAPPGDVAEDILSGLIRLINRYADESTPYLSKPRAEFAWSPSDYDRLARRAEWTTDEGEE
jgi:ATP-dependent helicase/nuclease subunit B